MSKSIGIKFFLLLIVCVNISNSLFINLDPRNPQCFYKSLTKGHVLTISYVVSGQNEDQVQIKVFDIDGVQRYEKSGRKELEYGGLTAAEKDQEYRICFKNLDGTQKILSFDFITSDEPQKTKNLATSSHVEDVLNELKLNFQQLEKIYRNQHYQQIRDEVHAERIESTERRVKWCAFIKILILIIICVSQVYILTSFFKNKKTGGV